MKRIFALILLSILFTHAHSSSIVVKYIYEKEAINPTVESISNYAFGIVKNQWDHIDLESQIEIPRNIKIIENNEKREVVIINYTIQNSGAYFLEDSFGHEILLDESMNNDTIVLNLKQTSLRKINKLGKNSYYLNDSVKTTKIYVITYPKRYKFMGFFDSLAYLHGDLMYGGSGYSFKELDHNLSKYLAETNRIYLDRVKFYKEFIKNNYMPSKLKVIAFKEIQYGYYNDLIKPILEYNSQLLNDYPLNLRDTIDKIGIQFNNQTLFDNVSFFRIVLAKYFYINHSGDTHKTIFATPDSLYIQNIKETSKFLLKGKLQNYLLAYLMQITIEKNLPTNFNLLYQDYEHEHSYNGVNKFVDSLYNINKQLLNIEPSEILNFKFVNKSGETHELREFINKKLILIDCWATWCIPCIQEMPFLDSLITKYKNQIQFISISADENFSKWNNWVSLNSHNNTLQLQAKDGFRNIFFKKLKINAIPRYLIIDNNGQIVNDDAPRPSNKEDLSKVIDGLLGVN